MITGAPHIGFGYREVKGSEPEREWGYLIRPNIKESTTTCGAVTKLLNSLLPPKQPTTATVSAAAVATTDTKQSSAAAVAAAATEHPPHLSHLVTADPEMVRVPLFLPRLPAWTGPFCLVLVLVYS